MRQIARTLALTVFAVAALTWNAAGQDSESLGDAARAARQEKKRPAKKVFTNDNLPTHATLSVVGAAATSSSENQYNAEDENEKQAEKQEDKKPVATQKLGEEKKESAPNKEDAAKLPEKISDDDKKISMLEKEIDLLQREYKMRIAEYYADAGLQLRDPKAWAEEDAKYQGELAAKQKQLSDAKDQREDLQEQARKAGQPSDPSLSPE